MARVQPLIDAPVGEALAVQRRPGELGLSLRILEPGEQPGLAQRHPARPEGLERRLRQGREHSQALHLRFAIAERPGDDGNSKPGFQHPADGGDDVGHMDRCGGVGQDHSRGLANRIGLHDHLHRMARLDAALVGQQAQGQQPAAAVERHPGLFAAPTRPDGEGLELAGREEGVREERHLRVGGLAGAQILRRDVEIAQGDGPAGPRGGGFGRTGRAGG